MKEPADVSNDKPRDPTPGSPISTDPHDALLWLVSFGDDDDRELHPPEIAEALRRGMIDGDTIVWREGQEDWAPLGSIPSLARLLPTTGETAAAPVVVMLANPTVSVSKGDAGEPAPAGRASVPRTMSKEPSKPAAKAIERPRVEVPSNEAQGGTPTEPLATDPKPAPAGEAANKTAEPWRGKTRLGLPKPPETKPIAFTGAAPRASQPPPPLPAAKRAGAPVAPTPAKTPDAPKAVAKTPDAPKVERSPSSQKGTSKNLWNDADDEPLSVDPESIRPMSPSPPMAKATALSSGTLGGPTARKPAPPAPKKKPAAPPARTEAGTPTIPTAATLQKKNDRAGDDIMNLGGGGMAGALLAPAVDLAAFAEDPVFSAERPPLDTEEVPLVEETSSAAEDETATLPLATSVALKETSAPVVSAKASVPREKSGVALAAPKDEKKRSVAPIVFAAAAAAALALIGVRKLGSEAPKPSVVEEEAPRAAVELPAPAEKPAEPVVASAEPSPAEPTRGASAPPAEPPAPPTTPMATSPGGSHAPKSEPAAPGGPAATKAAAVTAPAEKEPKPEKEPATKATPTAEPKPAEEAKAVDMGGDFDKSAAATALGAAADQASGCRKDGDPSGVAVVHVTFANSGHATRATLEGPPFAGTATGGCIAAALRGAQVPPYGGERVTVTKRVVIR